MQGRLPVALALAVLAAGCKGRNEAPPSPGTAGPTTSGRSPALDGGSIVAVAIAAAREARKDAEALSGACTEGPAYLALRQHAATLAPFVRPWASASAEVLVGPERPVGEGAGALAELDAALAAKDCAAAAAALAQVKKAVTLAEVELTQAKATRERGGELVGRAAFELGLSLAEASLLTPASPEASLAHARGTLFAVRDGAAALGGPGATATARTIRDLESALTDVKTLRDLPRRARLVRSTAAIGDAVADQLRALGLAVRGTYAVRGATRVSALDLPPRPAATPSRLALGARLFADPRFSQGAKRACAGCHRPDRAFTDGVRTPPSLDPRTTIPRNTPTLLYGWAAAAQRWDGRLVAPEDQALAVLHTKAEMGVTTEGIEAVLAGDAGYRDAFEKEGLPLTAASVGQALGAYVASLGAGSSPLDRFARGDDAAMGEDDHRGFDLFTGKGRCARCHVPPTFAGSRPTAFQLPVYAVLGVPATKGEKKLDPDRGRGAVTGAKADEGAFKTPTVRNAARTAPYFHQGAYDTLPEVVAFYDRGGGRGLGIAVENQDPDVLPLGLTEDERRLLVRFLSVTLADAP